MNSMLKRRFFAAGLALIIGLLAVNLTVNAFGDAKGHYEEVTVHSNDTLWTIAAQVTPNGYDVRNTIDTIRKINNLNSAILYPGQRLLVPRQ